MHDYIVAYESTDGWVYCTECRVSPDESEGLRAVLASAAAGNNITIQCDECRRVVWEHDPDIAERSA